MRLIDVFKFLQEQIHTVIVATTGEMGRPVTCAIDVMDYDEHGIYFLTAKGKRFYERLTSSGYLSLTGIKGDDTTSRTAVTVCGEVKEIGTERLQTLLDKNRYMYEIYPTEQSRSALTVFRVYRGDVEWFDLSRKPIERYSFAFGKTLTKTGEYFISDNCVRCEKCLSVCPQNCIVLNSAKAEIKHENCLRCGNCQKACPVDAVIRK